MSDQEYKSYLKKTSCMCVMRMIVVDKKFYKVTLFLNENMDFVNLHFFEGLNKKL